MKTMGGHINENVKVTLPFQNITSMTMATSPGLKVETGIILIETGIILVIILEIGIILGIIIQENLTTDHPLTGVVVTRVVTTTHLVDIMVNMIDSTVREIFTSKLIVTCQVIIVTEVIVGGTSHVGTILSIEIMPIMVTITKISTRTLTMSTKHKKAIVFLLSIGLSHTYITDFFCLI